MIGPLALFGLVCGAAAAWFLRRAWARRDGGPRAARSCGWALAGLGLAMGMALGGPVEGLAIVTVSGSVGALLVVAEGRIVRPVRLSREALPPEPLGGPSKAGRGMMRAVLAGPLGMTAAMGIAFCSAAWMPGDPRTRIVVGGLLMPIAWALAMTWTLADQRLLRALAVLAGTSIVGFALAAARGLA